MMENVTKKRKIYSLWVFFVSILIYVSAYVIAIYSCSLSSDEYCEFGAGMALLMIGLILLGLIILFIVIDVYRFRLLNRFLYTLEILIESSIAISIFSWLIFWFWSGIEYYRHIRRAIIWLAWLREWMFIPICILLGAVFFVFYFRFRVNYWNRLFPERVLYLNSTVDYVVIIILVASVIASLATFIIFR